MTSCAAFSATSIWRKPACGAIDDAGSRGSLRPFFLCRFHVENLVNEQFVRVRIQVPIFSRAGQPAPDPDRDRRPSKTEISFHGRGPEPAIALRKLPAARQPPPLAREFR